MASDSLPPLTNNTVAGFEFGKRKRWADLVVNELVDVLLLVLSSTGKILFCGAGLQTLLGWKNTDLIDFDFIDLLNASDKEGFKNAFKISLVTGSPMPSCYVRIRSASSTISSLAPPACEEPLFELNGRPQMIEAHDNAAVPMQVFFAMAKPHPVKTVEMLDTFIDLQEESERLQARVAELRARAPRPSAASPASSSTSNSMYATTSMVPTGTSHILHAYDTGLGDDSDLRNQPIPGSAGHLESSGKNGPDDEDGAGRKKKAQKKGAPTTEQYVCVTCGRTESPEWRKGPSGPKTLCNACGLRWAKQSKVHKMPEEAPMY
ncbi:white collar photoreceptors-like protein [Roridomyces roridus]|uniref:White collar photoreceptors-like protein n=1 Tax=Roridomyces roridus TaxID=1738132 RepID=A0AAD7FQW1_9AGAR|nr:white collar photoreceptors-like protein [Roridomyces roridus]